jgi:hypothetical protein
VCFFWGSFKKACQEKGLLIKGSLQEGLLIKGSLKEGLLIKGSLIKGLLQKSPLLGKGSLQFFFKKHTQYSVALLNYLTANYLYNCLLWVVGFYKPLF